MNNLISIIIPVYNVEKYLNRCVKSVVNQIYSNLEIILVDDGSDDSSPAICDEWAKRDSRIRVIHKDSKISSASIWCIYCAGLKGFNAFDKGVDRQC